MTSTYRCYIVYDSTIFYPIIFYEYNHVHEYDNAHPQPFPMEIPSPSGPLRHDPLLAHAQVGHGASKTKICQYLWYSVTSFQNFAPHPCSETNKIRISTFIGLERTLKMQVSFCSIVCSSVTLIRFQDASKMQNWPRWLFTYDIHQKPPIHKYKYDNIIYVKPSISQIKN